MTTKYLQYFPRPLLDDLVSGRWLPVVGAGMSLNAKLPAGKKMPLWPDLGSTLQGEFLEYSSSGTLDAISAYEHEFGRAKLIERLSEILYIRHAHPGDAHKAFCSIPFDIVCTTNFDFLLEEQYKAIPSHVYPVIDEEQLSINGSAAGTLLLKLHGDLHHPSRLVVTEEDYDAFLMRYPLLATFLSNQLITKTAVLIGYSLDDPDFRQLWSVVTERLGKTRRVAYSVMVNAKASDIARFERRGVKVVNLPGTRERYGAILAQAFSELREYMRDNVISVSQVTEEEPLRELMLPRDAASRLCFFSIPVERLSLYRSRVFPVVEEIGFVPVTADDVISPGDNINAKIDSLIDRASVMVVEMTSPWTRAEFEMAIARNKATDGSGSKRHKLEIIVVDGDVESRPPGLQVYRVVKRSDLLTDDIEDFVDSLVSELRSISENRGAFLAEEAQRLFNAREYRVAVISAISSLEAWLRQNIDGASNFTSPIAPSISRFSTPHRPTPFRGLLDLALQNEVLQLTDVEKILAWSKIRNDAVHNNSPVSRAVAKEIVDGVRAIFAGPTMSG
ncbi:putative membrane protein (plasmid) [Caballeronia cordobensis]|nr:putative membrane protein [Burkholderia sp. RPE67]